MYSFPFRGSLRLVSLHIERSPDILSKETIYCFRYQSPTSSVLCRLARCEEIMARVKQSRRHHNPQEEARKGVCTKKPAVSSTGGKAPIMELRTKAARRLAGGFRSGMPIETIWYDQESEIFKIRLEGIPHELMEVAENDNYKQISRICGAKTPGAVGI